MIAALAIVLIVLAVAAGTWLWTPDRDRTMLEAKYAKGPNDFVNISSLRLHGARHRPQNRARRDHAAWIRIEPAHMGALGAGSFQ